MQEGVAEQLPGLEVAAVHGPESKLCRNVLHQKYHNTGNNNADGYRWLGNSAQFWLLVQIYSPIRPLFWFTILQ